MPRRIVPLHGTGNAEGPILRFQMRHMEHGCHPLRDGREETSIPRYGKNHARIRIFVTTEIISNYTSMLYLSLHAHFQTLTDIVRMICEESPRSLPEGTSTPVISLISKMLRKDPLHRPKIDQLVVCPYLVPFIIRIYLNLGRTSNVVNKRNGNYDPEIFLRFLKSQVFHNMYIFFSRQLCCSFAFK